MEFAAVGPASLLAGAQLLFGLLACTLFTSLCLLNVPPPTHAVTFDSIYGLDADGRLADADLPVWIRAAPLHRDRSVRDERAPLTAVTGRPHVVAINSAGTFLFDGCAVDPVTLRMRIDRVQLARQDWFDLRPDPNAPWDVVDLALATLARAHVGRFRLDNRRFGDALDAPGSWTPRAWAAPLNCASEPPGVD